MSGGVSLEASELMAEEEEFVMAVGLHGVQPDDAVTAGSVVAVERLAQKYLDCFFQLEKQLVQCDDVLVQGNR